MTLEWVYELLRGLGRLFLHPMFYYVFILAALLGIARVKRERQDFHVRAENAYYELRQVLPLGLILGLIVSIVMIVIGIVIPIEMIIFVALFTFILSLTTKMRWLAPVYTVGLAFFATLLFLNKEWVFPLVESGTPQWNINLLPPMAVLLGLIVIVEGVLISRNGIKGSSPKIIKSKRGLRVGIHEVSRVWMLPVFLLIPGDVISAPFSWWPVFSIGSETYSILVIPFAIGFYQQVYSTLPAVALKQFGKKVINLGIILTVLSIVGYWVPLASIFVVALAMIARELLSMRLRLKEENSPLYFSRKQQGVMILGIIPGSPAEKMDLKVGEVIMKVNGIHMNSGDSFYDALEVNRAHCKLEVVDVNDQIRFVQRALYEGDPYKLGILFVHDEKTAN